MSNQTVSKQTSLSRIFVIFMGIQAVLELVIGSAFLVAFPLAVETGFDLTYISDMDIFGIVIGLQLILLAILMFLAIRWTMQGNNAGPVIGIAAGLYFLIFGIFSFIQFGDTQAIMVDSIRGLITAIMGYMVYQQIKAQKA
ncbi:MAG: hypothetical protein AB8H47_27275 [Bacteroidia bacterium]